MMTYRAVVSSIVLAFILIAHSADVISYGVIAFAQAHFLMAYYYQYKAGKINKAYVLRYVFAFLVVFGSYYFYGPNNWPVFLMGAYFVIHFLYDERYLMSESTDFYGWFRLFPIMIACAPVVFSSLGFDIYAEAKIALFVLGGGMQGVDL